MNFSEGLLPKIKLEVAKAGDDISLDEAYSIATACDETNNYAYRNSQALRQNDMNYQNYQYQNIRRGAPMDVDSFDRRNQKYRNQPSLSNEEREKLVKNNGCFYCRKNNAEHTARNCPKKKTRHDQHAVDLEESGNQEESTSEEDSDGYVIDANLVDSNDLKCSIDNRKYCFYFNKNNNFYETLYDLPSECEISQAEHKQLEDKESPDSHIL